VIVHLLSDGTETGMTGVLNAANHWSFTFSGLSYYKSDGTTPIAYSVREDGVSGYTPSYQTTTTAPTVTVTDTTTESFQDGRYYSISTGTNGYAMGVQKNADGTYSLVSLSYSVNDTAQLWEAVKGSAPEGYSDGSSDTAWFYLENVKFPGEWLYFYFASSDDTGSETMQLSSSPLTTFTISSAGQLYTMHKYTGAYAPGWYYKGVTVTSRKVGFAWNLYAPVGTDLVYRSATAVDGLTAAAVTNTAAAYTLPETGGVGCMPFILSGLALTLFPAALAIWREKKRRGGGFSPG
jgi:hypothetical protein